MPSNPCGLLSFAGAMMLVLAGCPAAAASESGPSPPPGHITGIGGVFFKSKDPKVLAAWYRDVLGVPLETWGGAMLRYDAPGHPPLAVWSPFPETTDYMAPSTAPFMVNFAVDDLDALVARLKAKGVALVGRDDKDNGRFAWILDPEGTKVELWEPKGR